MNAIDRNARAAPGFAARLLETTRLLQRAAHDYAAATPAAVPRITLACSLGAEDMVLAHLINQLQPLPTQTPVIVSLNPLRKGARDVGATVEAMRASVEAVPGLGRKSFTVISGGPPAGKAISVKVRGDDFAQLQAAADAVSYTHLTLPTSDLV